MLEARAIPFEVAHAGGNVAFALVAGPAMVRMLTRFRERFAWRRGTGAQPPEAAGDNRGSANPGLRPALRGGTLAALVLAALALAAIAPPRAAASGVDQATAWLRSVQNEDGGFGASPGDRSSPEITCWATLALSAGGKNPLDVASHGHTPVDYLRSHVDQLKSAGDYARTILALEGSGAEPRDFDGQNLVSKLLDRRRKDGSYEGWPGTTAFAVIALRAAGATGGLEKTLSWLRSAQNEDGGWGDLPDAPSTPDDTGAAMQALASDSKAVHQGLDYLRSHQHKGGGYALGGSGPVNTPSTAWAVQGILAAGGNPASFIRGGASALDYLAANQGSDGRYDYAQAGAQTSAEVAHQAPVWVTAEVIPAAARATFPIAAPPREPRPTTSSQTSSSAGGVPNFTEPAPTESVPLPEAESPPASPQGSASGDAGPPPERLASPGQSTSKAPAGGASPGGRAREGSGTSATEPPASEPGTDSSSSSGHDSSVAGAIVLGLLAGCLLFGAAWLARRGWMRWRYGL